MFLTILAHRPIVAMDRYFALVEERDTICCFLAFKEMRELPSIVNQLVTDL